MQEIPESEAFLLELIKYDIKQRMLLLTQLSTQLRKFSFQEAKESEGYEEKQNNLGNVSKLEGPMTKMIFSYH